MPRPRFADSARLIALAFLAAVSLSPSLARATTAGAHGPVMIGYFPVGSGLDASLSKANLGLYTHIDLAFANPDASGALAANGTMTCMSAGNGAMITADQLRDTVKRIHAAGPKALLSIGGGVLPACAGDWGTLPAPGRTAALVKDLVRTVDETGLDGIDVDLENAVLAPLVRSGAYRGFVSQLSATLKARGKLLTCATGADDGSRIPSDTFRDFDFISVMSYDAVGPSWGQPGGEHATVRKAVLDLDYWLVLGVSRDRLVLGLPFYGYGFGSYAPNYAFGAIAAGFGDAVERHDTIGSACGGCSYITYNSLRTLAAKTALARRLAGGVMVWNIAQDSDDARAGKAVKAALTGVRVAGDGD